jgi:hypothetical protein
MNFHSMHFGTEKKERKKMNYLPYNENTAICLTTRYDEQGSDSSL